MAPRSDVFEALFPSTTKRKAPFVRRRNGLPICSPSPATRDNRVDAVADMIVEGCAQCTRCGYWAYLGRLCHCGISGIEIALLAVEYQA
jgi:hypothetical protein